MSKLHSPKTEEIAAGVTPTLANGSTLKLRNNGIARNGSTAVVEMENLVSHVLSIVESSARDLAVAREAWRFRIAADPRFFMDEMQGKAFMSFYNENGDRLREVLRDLRDRHHFVIPHDVRIDQMQGKYLVMYAAGKP